jgi:ABC-type multidrug transport system fused ATPase/permease subunit
MVFAGEHLSYSDHVFAFDAEGKLHERHESKEIVQDLENLQKKDGNQDDQPLAEKDDEKAATSQSTKAASETNISDRQKGDFSLYGYYLKSTGLVAIALWIWTVWLAAVASRMPVIYIRLWMDEDPSNKLYYIGFALLGVGSLCATLVTVAIYYLRIVPKSSTTLHWRLLNTVLTSTLYWLSDTDTGSILNRFSQDVTLISQKLPISFLEACYLGTCVLVDIGIISSGSKYAAPIIPLFVLVLWAIQYFYLRTSRQLRLLDLELVSPLYSHFTESSNGIEHIRAFRWQEAFVQQLIVRLDRSQKPYYYLFAIQRWLILVLGLVTFMIAIVLVSFALNFIESTSETALGLALLNLITFSSNVADFVDSWVVLETSLGAVARVRDFTRNTPMEEDVDAYEPDLLENWPETGTIEFESVNASYKPLEDSSKRVLDDVSVTIPGGSKVAVTGRTGSGKSSLLLMLLHFLQYEGSVTIDGKDIRRVPRETLRDRLTTLTQDGVKLDGSVRANLDPRETATSEGSHDDAMITVLRRVNLWSIIEAGGGLDANLIGLSLSHGQMQLLSLARAVFHQQRTKSKIVLVDEATSNVDLDTDKCMQEVMTESFAGCTVIIIAHRVHVVEGADRVLRMEGGRIVAEETREENAA